jgi:hypothetical protein
VSDVPDIYGVWRLQSYYLENMQTAERTKVFGPTPNGVLILLPEGRPAIITPTEQRQPATEADEASAFRNLIAYSRLYRLEPPDSGRSTSHGSSRGRARSRHEGDPFGGPVAMRLGVGGSWSTVERTRLG